MPRLPLICFALAATLAGQTLACACTLTKVEIRPLTVENGETYVGQSGDVELKFHNDVQGRAVTVFPEPPLAIHHAQPASDCSIDDGGVWGRDGVWLTPDGNTLVTTESSGAYQGLVFHDTRSCAKVGEVDVSGSSWNVEGRSIILKQAAAPHAKKTLRLDASCRPPAASARHKP